MKILGISLGHDSNFALIEDGMITGMIEAERYFRQKRYKLSAQTLASGKYNNTYQYTDIEDLKTFLDTIKKEWGNSFDAIALQNQGRKEEFENLKIILNERGISFKESFHIDHHLSHASLSYFTSPFSKSLVLSFDGIGNDGKTVFFGADNNRLDYLANIPIAFGQSYSNLGYVIGIKPEIDGSTSGKVMGLTSYGTVKTDWIPYVTKYVLNYQKYKSDEIEGLRTYGKGHRMNTVGLRDIPDLKKYLKKTELKPQTFKDRVKFAIGLIGKYELFIGDPQNKDAQDLAATVQQVWTDEVLRLISKNKGDYKNVCVVGGCALNGTTNYEIEKSGMFEKVHFIPNPSDCGLSAGAGLYVYYSIKNNRFSGNTAYYSPYLGSLPFDIDKLEEFKKLYPSKEIPAEQAPTVLAKLVSKDLIVGVIRGRYEVGPRALGNRSIICNPLNKDMRDILNDKVKHREWYRPFAPMVTEEDSQKYFTNTAPVPYMSVICDTKDEYKEKLPSITHVDGTARIQTVNPNQNPFMHKALKEFEKITGMPIFLNTSFNPAGEPILNFCEAGLKMLDTTDLDLVIVENTVFSSNDKRHLLETI